MKKVLFLCIENSCRSQIAEALANHYYSGAIKAYSAGSQPSGNVNPDAIAVMKEIGIDISNAVSKGFEEVSTKEIDLAVSLGCGDSCPVLAGIPLLIWQVEDPKGKGIDVFRKTRDEIKKSLDKLGKTLLSQNLGLSGKKGQYERRT
ncbi:MAG: arsenate reductase ArsC [Candidatus Omnitrophica bacterium]|nr:arsenate reductase ArsC [Candidatus Omnitrophota bacterium]